MDDSKQILTQCILLAISIALALGFAFWASTINSRKQEHLDRLAATYSQRNFGSLRRCEKSQDDTRITCWSPINNTFVEWICIEQTGICYRRN